MGSKQNVGCAFIAADSVMTEDVSERASVYGIACSNTRETFRSGSRDLGQRANLIAQATRQAKFVSAAKRRCVSCSCAEAVDGVMLARDCGLFRKNAKDGRLDSDRVAA